MFRFLPHLTYAAAARLAAAATAGAVSPRRRPVSSSGALRLAAAGRLRLFPARAPQPCGC